MNCNAVSKLSERMDRLEQEVADILTHLKHYVPAPLHFSPVRGAAPFPYTIPAPLDHVPPQASSFNPTPPPTKHTPATRASPFQQVSSAARLHSPAARKFLHQEASFSPATPSEHKSAPPLAKIANSCPHSSSTPSQPIHNLVPEPPDIHNQPALPPISTLPHTETSQIHQHHLNQTTTKPTPAKPYARTFVGKSHHCGQQNHLLIVSPPTPAPTPVNLKSPPSTPSLTQSSKIDPEPPPARQEAPLHPAPRPPFHYTHTPYTPLHSNITSANHASPHFIPPAPISAHIKPVPPVAPPHPSPVFLTCSALPKAIRNELTQLGAPVPISFTHHIETLPKQTPAALAVHLNYVSPVAPNILNNALITHGPLQHVNVVGNINTEKASDEPEKATEIPPEPPPKRLDFLPEHSFVKNRGRLFFFLKRE